MRASLHSYATTRSSLLPSRASSLPMPATPRPMRSYSAMRVEVEHSPLNPDQPYHSPPAHRNRLRVRTDSVLKHGLTNLRPSKKWNESTAFDPLKMKITQRYLMHDSRPSSSEHRATVLTSIYFSVSVTLSSFFIFIYSKQTNGAKHTQRYACSTSTSYYY